MHHSSDVGISDIVLSDHSINRHFEHVEKITNFVDFTPSRPALVCDNGTFSVKAGFAGRDGPQTIIPTIVGRPRTEMITPGYGQRAIYTGEFVQHNRGFLDTSFPIRNCIITDWDAMEEIWNHMYYEELMVPPENFDILHTEPVNNPLSCREKLVEIMFELFNVPSMTLMSKSTLALYGNGRTSGLVVDSGYKFTEVVPIYEGLAFEHAVRTMPIGGWHITKYLNQLLNNRGYNFTTLKDMDTVKYIKETYCYCAMDMDKEVIQFTRDMGGQHMLPDGMVVKVNTEAFRATEILFNSSLYDPESQVGGIHNVIQKSINACNVDKQYLFADIVLSGGNTLFPNLPERLRKLMSKLVLSTTKVNIAAPPEREFSTWIGGSIFASSPNFQSTCITRSDFEEQGSTVVHGKCFF